MDAVLKGDSNRSASSVCAKGVATAVNAISILNSFSCLFFN